MDTAKVASVVAGIAFVMGLLYNFGYFVAIDLNFFTLLSYKDHLTVLVFFVPPSLLVAVVFGVYRRRIPQLDYVAGFLAAVVIISWIEGVEAAALPSLSAFLFWFRGLSSLFLIPYLIAVIVEFFSSDAQAQQDSGKQRGLGLSMIGLVIFLIMFGNFSGHIAVRARQYEAEVTLASDDKTPSLPRTAHLVRAIDDGYFLVFQDAPDRIAFFRKDAVNMLSKKVQK